MADMHPRPLLIHGAPEQGILLERVPLDGSDIIGKYNEDWVQEILYQFPQALPTGEIDSSFVGMVPICRELNVPPAGSLDVLYATAGGRLALVEAKLWRNPEARRKVVSQVLDYAQVLSQWSYENLDAAVRTARRKETRAGHPAGLFETVRAQYPATDERDFTDSVYRSLQRGDFLLLIAGDGIREGVGAITGFLEGHGSLHFSFGLIELAIYRAPDGARLIQPRIIAQSTVVKRYVVSLTADMKVKEEGADDDEVAPELQRERDRFQSFWREFLDDLRLDNQAQTFSKPARNTNQNFQMPPESTGWISAYLAQSTGSAGVYLTFAKGPVGDQMYEALRSMREEIDQALGMPVRWESDGGKHWVVATKQVAGDLLGSGNRAAVRTVLADWTNRFVTVFRPRIEALVRQCG